MIKAVTDKKKPAKGMTLKGQQTSEVRVAEDFLRELISRVHALDRSQLRAKQYQPAASVQQTIVTEKEKGIVPESPPEEVRIAENFLRDLASRAPSLEEAQLQLKEAVERWWGITEKPTATTAPGRKTISQMEEVAPASEFSGEAHPVVTNTFNVELRTETPKTDRELRVLADRINRILIEQARRHGIVLT
jgi:hypothetical protein